MSEDVVVFFGKREVRSPKDTTVGALLKDAGYTPPSDYVLELRKGPDGPVEHTYTDPNEKLTLRNGENFTAKYIGTIQPSNTNGR